MDSILYADFYGVPIMTYGMIGVTTLVLAYFTITDIDTNTTTEAAAPILPSFTTPTEAPPPTTGGGIKRRKKSMKKRK